MTFAAPLALLMLLPWTAAVAWVLMGRSDFAWVPFAAVWPTSQTDAPPRRRLRRPPLAIVLLLTAMLAALLAAAGPGLRGAGTVPMILIVDRGLATSAALAGGGAAAFDRATSDIAGATRVTWIDAATGRADERTFDAARASLKTLRPTAIDVAGRLPQVVRRTLGERDGPVVVVSLTDPQADASQPAGLRVQGWRPPVAVVNAGIERFAVTAGARPQAMVRVFNGTLLRTATIKIANIEKTIDLPAAGQSRDYFIDIESPGDRLTAELRIEGVADAVAADDVAYLARTDAWPRIEAAAPLPPALARLVRVYTDQRPPTAASRPITITAGPAPAGRAVVLAAGASAGAGDAARLIVTPHPITRDVDAPALFVQPRGTATVDARSPAPPAGDWRPIVRAGEAVLVAVRETPERQVWVGLDPSARAASAAYVVFWSNVLDYLGDGPATYASESPHAPPADWRRETPALPIDAAPGLFATPQGPRAISATAVRFDNDSRDSSVLALQSGSLPLRRPLLIGATVLIVAALCVGARHPSGFAIAHF